MDRVFPYSHRMTRRDSPDTAAPAGQTLAETLGKNLSALMAAHPELSSNPKMADRTGLGTGTIHRLRYGKVDCTMDTLQKLAKPFGIEPWQLLVPGLDPSNLPALKSVSAAEEKLWERLREVAKDIREAS